MRLASSGPPMSPIGFQLSKCVSGVATNSGVPLQVFWVQSVNGLMRHALRGADCMPSLR